MVSSDLFSFKGANENFEMYYIIDNTLNAFGII